MSKRGCSFLTPGQINKAKQAIDLLCTLTAECNDGSSTSTRDTPNPSAQCSAEGEHAMFEAGVTESTCVSRNMFG